ncbi:DUF6191 domain-containing protein [Kitasatospora sp. SUK 42]|uniref:DUF6191 domain-containing protein n=1 Tax=Kitasatospora sp. SUK 42 TaxID=1588882 RepID=UPI0018CA2D3C|nr:DUF6191 domain-containing protein [Kitasatospora sp. SUK 42]MBV2156283.1 hypothetical protein [Kitasatospora sp. SUK 42]
MGLIVGVACAVAAGVGLVLLAAWQVWGESSPRRRERGPGVGVGAGGGLDELHALFSPGKRVQIEQRREQLSRRDDTQVGAPPHFGVDLDRGVAVLRTGGDHGDGGGGGDGADRSEGGGGEGGGGEGGGGGRPGQTSQPREQSTSR